MKLRNSGGRSGEAKCFSVTVQSTARELTVIMFNPSLDVEIVEFTTSEKGRIIILDAQIDDTKFIFVNIYAPNDLAQQVNFFDGLKSKLVKYANKSIIVGGDFNCAITPSDRRGGCPVEKKGAVV